MLDSTDAPIGWEHVTADDGVITVTGWVAVPPPQRIVERHEVHEFDFSDDTIEGETPKPTWGASTLGTCLRAAPSDDAAVIGLVHGVVEHARMMFNGWQEITVDAPWGQVTGYVPAPLFEPDPPRPPSFEM